MYIYPLVLSFKLKLMHLVTFHPHTAVRLWRHRVTGSTPTTRCVLSRWSSVMSDSTQTTADPRPREPRYRASPSGPASAGPGWSGCSPGSARRPRTSCPRWSCSWWRCATCCRWTGSVDVPCTRRTAAGRHRASVRYTRVKANRINTAASGSNFTIKDDLIVLSDLLRLYGLLI